MAFKAILVLCASALLVNTISGQCIGNQYNSGLGLGLAGNGLAGCGGLGLAGNNLVGCNGGYGLGNGYAGNLGNLGNYASLSGGELLVTSSSPLAPSGLSVVSENALEGVLAVSGALPFLSAVALEGQVPSGGAAGVSYSCGNGEVGIFEQVGGAGLGYGAGLNNVGLVGAGLGYGVGLNNVGLGCGAGLGGYGAGNCGCGLY